MRSDLTAGFLAAMSSASRKPRQLLVFHFEAGDVFLSDQEITLGGITYQPLVEDWGELTEAGDPESEVTGGIRQMTITLWNGGNKPFSDHFLGEDPENVDVDLYQWFDGLTDADKALLDRLVVQDPIEFDENSRLLKLDLVSIGMRYDARIGMVLTRDEWPYALEAHLGKTIDMILGAPGQVKTVCAKTAPQATLDGSIISSSITIAVRENLNELGFPAAGEIQIDEEHIYYSARTASAFTASIRGYRSTEKADHSDGAPVIQRIFDHTYLVGQGPLQSITNVKVAGYPAPASIYSVNAASNPARITFNQKPYSVQFAPSSSLENVTFDDVGPGNTAFQPHNAFDEDANTSSAMISRNYPVLALVQVNANVNLGQIVRARLVVHHWETNYYLNDHVEVWVEGANVIGNLSRPSSDDNLVLKAEVDIDHPHDHETGGQHDHPFADPWIGTNNPSHDHPLAASEGRAGNSEYGSYGPYGFSSSGGGVSDELLATIWFNNLYHTATSSVINLNIVSTYTGTAQIYYIKVVTEWGQTVTFNDLPPDFSGTLTINGGSWPYIASNQNYWVKVYMYLYVNNGSISIKIINPLIKYDAKVSLTDSRTTAVSAYINQSGDVSYTQNDIKGLPIKDKDDVQKLLTDNRPLEILSKQTPTRTIIDKFDLTDFVSVTWAWYTGRDVQLRYIGTTDDVKIFIPHMYFEVEYRARTRVFSDEVSAEVVGGVLPSNRPDTVIKTLLTGKADLPAELVDTASFNAAGARFDSLGYALDGILPGSLTVREAIKKICLQSRARFMWSAGLAKLRVRDIQADWSGDRLLLPDNLALRSLTARRTRVDALVNVVELFYGRDHTAAETGREAYTGSVSVRDNLSIQKHGEHANADRWLFDLVADGDQAASLADFYLAALSTPSTIYEFLAYLDQFDLERGDHLQVTSSGFNQMRKTPMEILSADRVFGSGKGRRINRIRIKAINWFYLLKSLTLNNGVSAIDSLIGVLGKYLELADGVQPVDLLKILIELPTSDAVSVAEALASEWVIRTDVVDGITTGDALSCELQLDLFDGVTAWDRLIIWRDIGYGGGGYGEHGYGGVALWIGPRDDEAGLLDELLVALKVGLSEEVTAGEELLFSDGYGNPAMGSGYGLSPYGR
ncbi:MAG: hypothetical protein OEV73_05070 [Desulfobulbaceae bacterium]|nr:hypothetical protein [Desulfobulbaceae bacterium]